MSGNARNGLSDQSQRYIRTLEADVNQLKTQMALIQSLNPNGQIARLSQGVGNSSVSVVPIPYLSWTVPGAQTPLNGVNFRYDWATFNLQMTANIILTSVPSANTLDNINVGLWDGGTGASLGSQNMSINASASSIQVFSLGLVAAVRTSAMTQGVQPYVTISSLAEGYTNYQEALYSVNGCIIHTKDA